MQHTANQLQGLLGATKRYYPDVDVTVLRRQIRAARFRDLINRALAVTPTFTVEERQEMARLLLDEQETA